MQRKRKRVEREREREQQDLIDCLEINQCREKESRKGKRKREARFDRLS